MKHSILMELLPLILILQAASSFCNVNGFIGMNWGRMSSQRIIPSMVVDMLLQNGIGEVKVFSSSDNVLDAFRGTDIGITVTVPNGNLKNLATPEACQVWVDKNLLKYVKSGVNVRYVTVGAQPFSKVYFNETFFDAYNVLQNMQTVLKRTDFGGKIVKATMNHFMDILNDAHLPSESDFNSDVKELMIKTCNLLKNDDAPIWLDMFPLYNAINISKDIEFAFFDNNSTAKFMDGDKKYTNVFEVVYDKFMVALEKNGVSGLRVFGGQLGWPTDGIEGGNIPNAERFYNGLVRYFHSGKGTPRHPEPIDIYIHNFADENRLPIKNETRYNRHWGIYKFDGKAKFNMDFSGEGRLVKPVSAKGITYMPKRWCVYNEDTRTDDETIKNITIEACAKTDCTSLFPGGSCNNLTHQQKISYVFNMFFQTKSQRLSDQACNFGGFGMIVPDDPSTELCMFPVGIIQAETAAGRLMQSNTSNKGDHIPLFLNFLLLLILVMLM